MRPAEARTESTYGLTNNHAEVNLATTGSSEPDLRKHRSKLRGNTPAGSPDDTPPRARRAPAAPLHGREQFEELLWRLITGPERSSITSHQLIIAILGAHDLVVEAAIRAVVIDTELAAWHPAPGLPAVHFLATSLRTGCGQSTRDRPLGYATAIPCLVTCQHTGCANPRTKGTPS